MEKKIITFTADEQSLRKTGGIPNYASNKVSYIEAQFELGENWQGFDAVRAIWYNKAQTISMVLADGKCIVPYEVLANKGQVMVNLVGSISENDVLTDRLTTYPVVALIVDADAKVDGSNTQPITPSQFEQFVEVVKADAESASESAESASASAESAHDDKIEIEQKIAEVIQQIEDFEQVEVVVNTLPAGSQATSDFTDGVLTLGIPQGAKGDTGNGISSCVLNPDYTLTINFTDGTSYTTTSIRGAHGVKGDTGNGISSITKTGSKTVDGRVVDTYTTTFTDGETTEFEVTNGKDGEVTMSQLSALLPTDTASGSIASFTDGTALVPALSVKATIEPIQSGSGTPSPDNVRPISGHTECVTEVCGVNVWDEEWEVGNMDASGNNGTGTSTIRSKNYIDVSANTPYYFHTSGYIAIAYWYDANKTHISSNSPKDGAVTSPSNARYLRFYMQATYGTSYKNDISVNNPSTDHDYHAYNGNTYTTPLGRTVYGGSLDLVSGVLTVDKYMYHFMPDDWTFESGTKLWRIDRSSITPPYYMDASVDDSIVRYIVCDKYRAVSYSSLVNDQIKGGIAIRQYNNKWVAVGTDFDSSASESRPKECYVVMKLATPQTYQLDPTEVDLLLGQNNVWSDCGEVEVTYKADIERWVNKKINALI